jgi:glutamate--cysteine ligase
MDKKLARLLQQNEHAIEREYLRVDGKARLSQRPHPKELGSALANPYISTDFAESQLELVAPISKSERGALDCLKDIHIFVAKHLGKEYMWTSSMPCKLPKAKDIPIGQYGSSREGVKKRLYRIGLSHRYGSKMQTISGIHYNFSFSQKLWKYLYKQSKSKKEYQQFIDDGYFATMRNIRRNKHLVTYLFGSTPAIDKSFLNNGKPEFLSEWDHNTYYGEYATSLRTSKIGYNSKMQRAYMDISYNNAEEYARDIQLGTSTQRGEYAKIGIHKNGEQIQINDSILQIENEYYPCVRPKQIAAYDEAPSEVIKEKGVKYIEYRALDICPFCDVGISEEQLRFMNIFITYCMLKRSPRMEAKDRLIARECQELVALYGRDPELKITDGKKKMKFTTWALDFLRDLRKIAKMLDEGRSDRPYTQVLELQFIKIKNPHITPSGSVLKLMEKSGKGFADFTFEQTKRVTSKIRKEKVRAVCKKKLEKAVVESLHKQEILEINTEMSAEGYEDLEGSTQLLIKEALKRDVKVEVLDRGESFVRLTKGNKTEYIKQANQTSADSLISFLIMENKHITKSILRENGILVPNGEIYYNNKTAKSDYPKYVKKKIVIKPTSTNYGIAVNFAEPGDEKGFNSAVDEAFKHGKSILVEEFMDGKEYRFLVIGGKVVSVLHRIPANITGDGKHKIKDLVEMKNADPRMYKSSTGYIIRLGAKEKAKLKSQKLTINSILKKGQLVFLRDNSNLHSGGDPVEVTDKMDSKYKKIAIRATKAVGAKICGVDMIIKNSYAIIEMNFNPAMQMHDFNITGKNRHVEKAVLDLLGF